MEDADIKSRIRNILERQQAMNILERRRVGDFGRAVEEIAELISELVGISVNDLDTSHNTIPIKH